MRGSREVSAGCIGLFFILRHPDEDESASEHVPDERESASVKRDPLEVANVRISEIVFSPRVFQEIPLSVATDAVLFTISLRLLSSGT